MSFGRMCLHLTHTHTLKKPSLTALLIGSTINVASPQAHPRISLLSQYCGRQIHIQYFLYYWIIFQLYGGKLQIIVK